MSEKIYACFLRLYPRRFRETYGGEAVQLFRDRYNEERGSFPRLRLWFDLLTDLVTSVPREYHRAAWNLAAAPAPHSPPKEHPAFYIADRGPLPLKQTLAGGLLSLLSFLIILFPTEYGARIHSPNISTSQMQSVDLWPSFPLRELSPRNWFNGFNMIVLGKRLSGQQATHRIQAAKLTTLQGDRLAFRIHSSDSSSGSFATPAGQAFWTWFCAFNSRDSKTLETYAGTPSSELRFRALTGGFRLQQVINSEPRFIRVLLRDRTNWTRFLASICVSDEVRFHVVSFGLTQMPKGSSIEEINGNACK